MTGSLLLLAWHSLAGNLRRTLLTVAAIAIGLAAMIFLWGFSGGLQHNMLANFQDTIVGSLQVHRRGFFKHPELARHIARPEEVIQALEPPLCPPKRPSLTRRILQVLAERK